MMNFCIHENYISKTEKTIFQDTRTRTDEFQNEVYKLLKSIVVDCGISNPVVADIGAGSGYKLEKWIPEVQGEKLIGYELEPNLSFLREKYPNKTWIESDFDSNPLKADIVICADVIEHLINPDKLMEFITKMEPKHVIISTPDRDLLVEILGRDNNGPPQNPYHIREWSKKELSEYISRFFNIVDHYHEREEYQQIIHCSLT